MSLLSLPNEIILQIAEDLSPAQLNSLLRVNRRLANVISHALLESLFRTRSSKLGALALFSAAERDDWRVVKCLVDRGILSFAGDRLLLNRAIEKTRSERVVATLLAYGVEADTWEYEEGEGGGTPLWIATNLGCWDIVRLLLGRQDVDPNGQGTGAPLITAVKKNDVSMARLLLTNPKTKINPADSNGDVPLQIALEKGYLEMALLLMVDERSDVNTTFNTGWSPLQLAASTGNETMVRVLLSDPNIRMNAQNHRGWTALHVAMYKDFVVIARILLSDERCDVNIGPPYHRTALHIAVQGGNPALVQLLLNNKRTRVNLGPPYHRPPLHWAVQQGNLDILSRLLHDPRIDVNVTDHSGQTPLHVAVAAPDEVTLKYLLRDPRVDVNAKNSWGKTPFAVAVKKRRDKAALALLAREDLDRTVVKPKFMKKMKGLPVISSPPPPIDALPPAVRVESKRAVVTPALDQGIGGGGGGGGAAMDKGGLSPQKGFGKRLKDVVTGFTMRRRG